jgi:hypothetical protein
VKRALALQCVVLLWVALAPAQSPGNNQPSVIMAPVGPVQVHAGASTKIDLAFRVGAGFHINSNKPHSDFLIPTQLKLASPDQISVATVTYPAGTDETFPFSPDEKLSVYSGDFSVTATVKAPAKAAAGSYPVKGELTYQACDKAACYPPKSMPVQFQVTVLGK